MEIKLSKTKFYAHKDLTHSKTPKEFFCDIHPNTVCVGMCGSGDIYEIELSVSSNQVYDRAQDKSNDADYWGWVSFPDNNISMIFPSHVQVTMCFPYDYKLQENKGAGKLIRLDIQEVQKINAKSKKTS